ncbi:MarR family winged helix-turn-helix transcriptional regulator [Plantactinospora siamensis]|uniref:MarR family winged helix-turn-helix transcriptional regulator n=1 Tax=Plantactinospora siamensis TaxID=555372 RepID=A0ABV6P013_9ACTN
MTDDVPARPPTLLAITTFLLSKVGHRARRRLAERLSAYDLKLWHVAALAALADHGPASQRDLGTRLGMDPSDLVGVLDHLEAAGRVERRRDPADRRRYVVSVTPAGRSVLAEVVRLAADTEAEMLAPLTARERRQLHDLLHRVFTHPG